MQEMVKDDEKSYRVSYLGPEATFTHEAALRFFSGQGTITFKPEIDIISIFKSVENDEAMYGIVPIENALEGTVNITLDLLIESTVLVVGEIYLPIDIHLLSKSSNLENIKKVLSHPHAIAQCRNWFRENAPEIDFQEVSSTSLAAKYTSEDPSLGALSSAIAAEVYGLNIVVEKLDTSESNSTRFFVIGKRAKQTDKESKTSFLFVLKNQPGALYRFLKPIAERKLNLTKIESRPSKRQAWDYVFFVDVEGHSEDPVLVETINELKNEVSFFRILGSYPKDIFSG
ncbi:MAG: prephenate dehydratase [Nitrospinota bacterium]|nr:prephenate dehydratase [Nitrospinota bacterium]